MEGSVVVLYMHFDYAAVSVEQTYEVDPGPTYPFVPEIIYYLQNIAQCALL